MSYVYELAKSLVTAYSAPADFLFDFAAVMDGALKNIAVAGVPFDDTRVLRLAEIDDAIHNLRTREAYARRAADGDKDGSDDEDGGAAPNGKALSSWSMGNSTYAGLGFAPAFPSSAAFADDASTAASTLLGLTFDHAGGAVDETAVDRVHALFTSCRGYEDCKRALQEVEGKLAKHSKQKKPAKAAAETESVVKAREAVARAEAVARTAITDIAPKLYADFKTCFIRICEDMLLVLDPVGAREALSGAQVESGELGDAGDDVEEGPALAAVPSTSSRGLAASEATTSASPWATGGSPSVSAPASACFPIPPEEAERTSQGYYREDSVDDEEFLSVVRHDRRRTRAHSESGVSAATTSRLSAHGRLMQANLKVTGQRDSVLVELADISEQRRGKADMDGGEGESAGAAELCPNELVWSTSGTSYVESSIRLERRSRTCSMVSEGAVSVGVREGDERPAGLRTSAEPVTPTATAPQPKSQQRHRSGSNARGQTQPTQHFPTPEARDEVTGQGGARSPSLRSDGGPSPYYAAGDALGQTCSFVEPAMPHGSRCTLVPVAHKAANAEASNAEEVDQETRTDPLRPSGRAAAHEETSDSDSGSNGGGEGAAGAGGQRPRQLTAAALAEFESTQRFQEAHVQEERATQHRDASVSETVSEQAQRSEKWRILPRQRLARQDDMWFRYYFFDRLKSATERVPLLYGLVLDHFQRIARKSGLALPTAMREDIRRAKDEMQGPQLRRRRQEFDAVFKGVFQYRKNLEILRWKLKLVKEAEAKLVKHGGGENVSELSKGGRLPAASTQAAKSPTSLSAASAAATGRPVDVPSSGTPSPSPPKRGSARKVNKHKVAKWEKELQVRRADVAAWKEVVFVKGADEMLAFYEQLADILRATFEDFLAILKQEGPSTSYFSNRPPTRATIGPTTNPAEPPGQHNRIYEPDH